MQLAAPGPSVTELVPVRAHQHDTSWPPVLVFCVVVAALVVLIAAVVFLRRAWSAGEPPRRRLDG